jgi:hypothetical protein
MSDVEPTTPEPAKEGGLKEVKPTTPPADDSGEADIETEEESHGSKDGGMIGEG